MDLLMYSNVQVIALTILAVIVCTVADGSQQVPLRDNLDNVGRQPVRDWILTTDTFKPDRFQERPYVANGYFGQSLPAEGVGYWIDRNHSSGKWAVNGKT